jgi:Mannosyl-glycoprotein endo-beta-N-acetylglucosaminidase/N-acetylmuramoyl-L-alanine amidase
MGRIFVAAGYGELIGNSRTLAAVAEAIAVLRDLVGQNLRSREYETLVVPDDLNLEQATDWINRRAHRGDVALELCASGLDRGVAVYHIAHNDLRKAQADLMLQGYLRRVPQMSNRGAKPDTQSSVGNLPFCRWTTVPALVMEVGLFGHGIDRHLIQTQQQEMALGISEGLAGWSHGVAGGVAGVENNPFDASFDTSLIDVSLEPRVIDINLNGALFDERGILSEGNAYVPFDLVDQFGLDLSGYPKLCRINYCNAVYVRAADLRDCHISVKWDSSTGTIYLRSQLMISPHQIGQIMGQGYTSELQMMMFLKTANPDGWEAFADLPKYYREEGGLEGVNYDLAFAQMCVETQFLQFLGATRPEHHNFGGLSDSHANIAQFASQRLGVRSHIQHLKAYGSTESLVQAGVDPRFRFIRRGVAPRVELLGDRWRVEVAYGAKILNRLKQLYEFVGLL